MYESLIRKAAIVYHYCYKSNYINTQVKVKIVTKRPNVITRKTSLAIESPASCFFPSMPIVHFLNLLSFLLVQLHLVIVVLAVQNPQNRQEQVDNVQVQADCGGNLLLDMIMSHNQLRVHQNISAEDQASYNTIPKLDSAAMREER